MDQYLSIDVGGTAIKYALMNEDAHIINQGDIPTPHQNLPHFLETLDSIVLPVKDQIKGIAMSMPGKIDNKTGFAHTGGALIYISETPMGDLLRERYHLPVAIENDGKCAALAEAWKGNLSDVDSGVVIILGTGIGGGIVLNKKVWRGFNGSAGELSACPTDYTNLSDFRQCWAYKNGVVGLTMPYAQTQSVPVQEMNGKIFFQDLLAGNPQAKEIFEHYVQTMLAGILNIQAILDVEKICIGGGISAQDILIDTISQTVHHYFEMTNGMLPINEPMIDRCLFRNDANLVGALKNFFDQQ